MPVELVDPTGGRAALEKLLAGHTARTQRLAAKVAKVVAAAVAKGEDPVQAVAAGMDAVGMAKAVRDTVATSVVQSVCIGYGIWPTVSALPPEAMGTLRTTALSGVWDDKRMTLSAQLHGTDKAMRDEIVQAVKGHVDAKASAWDAQRKIYDGYGFGGAIHKDKLPELPQALQDLADKARKVLTPEDFTKLQADAKRLRAYSDRLATGPLKAAYGQMADRLEKGLTKGLDRLVKTATEEKARYHASRILRTETANAWGQGFVQECAENPDVVAIRWKTSSAHKIFDVCDFCATANLYGMGPGVYPKAKLPRYCAHPHCFCNLLKVFLGQVPPEHDNVNAGGRAALAGMTDSQRARLLTIKGAQGFKGGSRWQGDLRNWQGAVTSGLSPGAKAVVVQAKASIPAPQIKSFVPAKSIKEAEQWARDNNLADRVSYKGLHIDAVNSINQAIKAHLDEFPKLRDGLQFIGSAQERNRLAKAARKADGWSDFRIRRGIKPNKPGNIASSADAVHVQFNGFLGIAFNEKAIGADFALRDSGYDKLYGIGKWFVPGKDVATDAVSHELGHQLDALYGLRNDPEVLALWKQAAQAKGGWEQSISGYARKGGIKEGIAEGWAEAFGSVLPRDFAKGLKEVILKKRGAKP